MKSNSRKDTSRTETCPEQGPRGTLRCGLPKKGHGSLDIHVDPRTGARWAHPKTPYGIRAKRNTT